VIVIELMECYRCGGVTFAVWGEPVGDPDRPSIALTAECTAERGNPDGTVGACGARVELGVMVGDVPQDGS